MITLNHMDTPKTVLRTLEPEAKLQNGCCCSHTTDGAQSISMWEVAKHRVLSQVPELAHEQSSLLPAIFASWPTF